MSNKETAPGPPSGAGQITVTVHGLQDGDEVFFRINKSSGRRLRAEQTPNDLEMEEGDEKCSSTFVLDKSVQNIKFHQSGTPFESSNSEAEQWKGTCRTMSNEVTKPAHIPGGGHIILKVKNQSGGEVFLRMRRSSQLKKLMYAYCDRQSVDHQNFAFMFDGLRLRGEETPDDLEMEDGDEIYALLSLKGC